MRSLNMLSGGFKRVFWLGGKCGLYADGPAEDQLQPGTFGWQRRVAVWRERLSRIRGECLQRTDKGVNQA